MKRFFSICIAALLAAASFAQVNLWRTNGYLTQFEKATLDSFTISLINPYTEFERAYEGYPTGEQRDMFDLQKALYVGLENLGYRRHNDFGWAAVCMLLDSRGQDFVNPNSGYNWFGVWGDPNRWRDNDKTTTAGLADYLVWYTCYKPILAANYVIATHTSGNEEDNYAVAQAKALRAFEYMQLAQAYQVAYSESSLNLPCVPLVLDTMPAYMILNETPATVAQVYAQIKSDLDAACANLEGYMRPSKHVINQAVAYGLRARYNLLVHKYNQAATDAEQALLLSGATPLSIAEANQPGFADASAHNVLWANIINEEDDIVQTSIVNWPSNLSNFYGEGYTSTGQVHPAIASELYGQIPATDVRKGWWLNENLESPLLSAEGYSERADALQVSGMEFANVKFGTGDRSTTGLGAAAGDWIVMRAEELILLRAEALERAGKDGASVLTNFVTTYRDPSYDINAHGLSVADEIWWQRRVELWGEGFAFNDLMRLHKGVTRTTSANWPDAWNQNVPADDDRFPLAIPAKDEDYKVLAVWRNGEKDLYNTSYFTIDRVDSITVGEAKEIDDVRIGYFGINKKYQQAPTFTRTFKEGKMGEVSDSVLLQFGRAHNIINPITVPLIIEADPVFAGTAFPKSISFEGGSDYSYGIAVIDTSFVVNVKELPVGTYQFTIAIPDEYCQGTLASYENQSFTYQIIVNEPDEWDMAEIKQGVWVDDAVVSSTFSVEPSLAWTVDYQVVEKGDGSKQIRIINPYAGVATSKDAYDIYDGCPFNDPGDWDESKDYSLILTVNTVGGVTMDNSYLGPDWGYGVMFLQNYPTAVGAYDAVAGRVTFTADHHTLVFGMGSSLYSYAGFRFYESKAAYLNDQPAEAPAKAAAPAKKTLKNGLRPLNSKKAAFQSAE
jgi:hypothetical protein